MAVVANWEVTIPGLNKTQSLALAIEFWTGQGYIEHQSSYNRIVFRKNGYGTITSGIKFMLNSDDVPWEQAPIELTVHFQVLPNEAKYHLSFTLGGGVNEKEEGDFSEYVSGLCDAFLAFNQEWIGGDFLIE